MALKGIIFTIDALIALSIFIIASLSFYPYFVESQAIFGLKGYGIYSRTQNFLDSNEKAGIFSSAVNLYERGDISGANSLLNLLLSNFEYSANLRIYLLNDSSLKKIIEIKEKDFDEKLLFRKYAVFTIDRGIPKTGSSVLVTAPSTLANSTLNVNVTVSNNNTNSINVVISLLTYDYENNETGWDVTPNFYSDTIPAESNATYIFNVTIPNNAIIDEYYAKAIVAGDLNENATDPFNVVKFGLIEAEVGD